MAKRRFNLTEEREKELIGAFTHCKDGPTRTRYQAVRLYGIGYPTQEVMKITGCSWSSMMEWCRTYRTEGVAGLVDKRKGGNRAKLRPVQIEDLKVTLHSYSPGQVLGQATASPGGHYWSVEDLQRVVQQRYGVSYQSHSSYCRLFDLCGFSYQKPEKVYKSRSELKVVEFEAQVEKN